MLGLGNWKRMVIDFRSSDWTVVWTELHGWNGEASTLFFTVSLFVGFGLFLAFLLGYFVWISFVRLFVLKELRHHVSLSARLGENTSPNNQLSLVGLNLSQRWNQLEKNGRNRWKDKRNDLGPLGVCALYLTDIKNTHIIISMIIMIIIFIRCAIQSQAMKGNQNAFQIQSTAFRRVFSLFRFESLMLPNMHFIMLSAPERYGRHLQLLEHLEPWHLLVGNAPFADLL